MEISLSKAFKLRNALKKEIEEDYNNPLRRYSPIFDESDPAPESAKINGKDIREFLRDMNKIQDGLGELNTLINNVNCPAQAIIQKINVIKAKICPINSLIGDLERFKQAESSMNPITGKKDVVFYSTSIDKKELQSDRMILTKEESKLEEELSEFNRNTSIAIDDSSILFEVSKKYL